MTNKLMFTIIFFTFINVHIVYSKTYFCPKTPINITIGKNINDNWFIWKKKDNLTNSNKYYYKIFTESYNVKTWNDLTIGMKTNSKLKKYGKR